MARFFIDRPVFAWVISILLMGVGILVIRLCRWRNTRRSRRPR